jgi:fructan beta-fructosidase
VDEGRYSITNLAFPEQGPEHTLRAELTTGAVVADAEWHLLTPGK